MKESGTYLDRAIVCCSQLMVLMQEWQMELQNFLIKIHDGMDYQSKLEEWQSGGNECCSFLKSSKRIIK